MAKTTRVCKICGVEKSTTDGTFGPTARQVACKGPCMKEYTRQALERAALKKDPNYVAPIKVQKTEEPTPVEIEETYIEIPIEDSGEGFGEVISTNGLAGALDVVAQISGFDQLYKNYPSQKPMTKLEWLNRGLNA